MQPKKDIIVLQHEELDINKITNLAISPNCGAISSFIGTTRDSFENKRVIKLEYEAYKPMALKEMNNICVNIRSKWNVEYIVMYHRLGEVPVSEASVVIVISSPHRQESLKAVEYAIESLKSSVPIWKKEVYDSHESEWKENKECPWSNLSDEEDKPKITDESLNWEKSSKRDPNVDLKNELVDPNLVQVRASSNDLSQRIASFIDRKRQQVNVVNIQEFCPDRNNFDGERENSCARVDAVLTRRKDSKSHVKVHRVFNTCGPQLMDPYSVKRESSKTKNQTYNSNYSSVLDERIFTTEKILGIMKPISKDIYERLKQIEDKVLFLEGVSPEYKEFWVEEDMNNLKGIYKPVRKRTYSTAELDSKLQELETNYVKRMK